MPPARPARPARQRAQARLRGTGRRPGAPRGPGRIPAARTRRRLPPGTDPDHARFAAGDRSDRPRPARPGRPHRPRRAPLLGLPLRPGRLRRRGRAGPRRRRGSAHRRTRDARRPARRVRHALAPVPDGRRAFARATPRPALLGGARTRLRARGRLRRRVPLRRAPRTFPARARPRRARALPRHREQGPLPFSPTRLAGAPRSARAPLHPREGLRGHRLLEPRAARARRVHRGRPPRTTRAAGARPERQAARSPRGRRRRHLPEAAELEGTRAGLHGLLWIPDLPRSEESVFRRACEQRGVGLYPIHPYYARPPERAGFLLGYAALSPEAIGEGIERMAQALADFGGTRGPARVRAKRARP